MHSALFALALCVCAGCSGAGTSTRGKDQHASFAFLAQPGCTDGCNLEDSSVASDGATQLILVNLDGGRSYASTMSSAPQVATFTGPDGNGNVVVQTAQPGDADLVLLDGAGVEVDRVTVHVAAAAFLYFDSGWAGANPVVLAGTPIYGVDVEKHDAARRLLLGTGAVHFSVDGTLTLLGPPAPSSGPVSVIETVRFSGQPGLGTLAATSAEASLSVPVTVLGISVLSGLHATLTATMLGPNDTVDALVETNVTAGADLVYGTTCVWTVSDPSVQILPQATPDHLSRPPNDDVIFRMTKAGKFSATCTVGPLTVTIPFSR
jgi:hypothetical protein